MYVMWQRGNQVFEKYVRPKPHILRALEDVWAHGIPSDRRTNVLGVHLSVGKTSGAASEEEYFPHYS